MNLFKNVGPGWVRTSVPVFSPDKKVMAFATEDQTIIRDVSKSSGSAWDVRGEKFLWSWDSTLLAIYASNRKIYVALPNKGDLQEIYSMSAFEDLEDWIWFADHQHIILIVECGDGNRQIRVLSVLERCLIQ